MSKRLQYRCTLILNVLSTESVGSYFIYLEISFRFLARVISCMFCNGLNHAESRGPEGLLQLNKKITLMSGQIIGTFIAVT